MHELYLAEQILDQILKKADEEGAEEIVEASIVIPKSEHFTRKEFEDILKMQAEGTRAENAKFKISEEETKSPYIKEIKVQ